MPDTSDPAAVSDLTNSALSGKAPNPTALRALTPEDVDLHRSISCAEYDNCLDKVLRHGWSSWTCAHCELFSIAR